MEIDARCRGRGSKIKWVSALQLVISHPRVRILGCAFHEANVVCLPVGGFAEYKCFGWHQNILCCHVYAWLKTGIGLVIGFINNLQIVTTNNYNTITDLHNLQSLHTNLLSLSALVLMDL
jgi:hypothetical protein